MNKEFSQIVSIYLESQVDSIIDHDIIPKDGQKPTKVFSQPFNVENKFIDSVSSPLMQSSIKLVVDKLSPEEYKILSSNRRAFIQCTVETRSKVIGVQGFPTYITVTPDLTQDIIEAVAKVPLARYR